MKILDNTESSGLWKIHGIQTVEVAKRRGTVGQDNGSAVYIFICGIDHFLHFWFVISFVSELKWLNPGNIKTTLRINKNRFMKSYLQMFSVWRCRPKIPLFWWMSRIKKRRGSVKSFHIRVSWFSSADFGPKTPLLSFFFSVCKTQQKEVHIRTM